MKGIEIIKNQQLEDLERSRVYITVGDRVRYRGDVYEVIRNRYNGMYDIAQIIERGKSMYTKLTNQHDCVYGDELQLVK